LTWPVVELACSQKKKKDGALNRIQERIIIQFLRTGDLVCFRAATGDVKKSRPQKGRDQNCLS